VGIELGLGPSRFCAQHSRPDRRVGIPKNPEVERIAEAIRTLDWKTTTTGEETDVMKDGRPVPHTPKSLRERLGTADHVEVDAHVVRINRMLEDGGRTYACSLFESYRVREAVVDAFSAWDVRHVLDDRDGDFLEFRVPVGGSEG